MPGSLWSGSGGTAERSNRLPLRGRCSRGRSSTVISGAAAARRCHGGAVDLPRGVRKGRGRGRRRRVAPLVARHLGLAEVAAGLEEEYPERFRHLASFDTGDVADLARKLNEVLALSPAEHDVLRSLPAGGR